MFWSIKTLLIHCTNAYAFWHGCTITMHAWKCYPPQWGRKSKYFNLCSPLFSYLFGLPALYSVGFLNVLFVLNAATISAFGDMGLRFRTKSTIQEHTAHTSGRANKCKDSGRFIFWSFSNLCICIYYSSVKWILCCNISICMNEKVPEQYVIFLRYINGPIYFYELCFWVNCVNSLSASWQIKLN